MASCDVIEGMIAEPACIMCRERLPCCSYLHVLGRRSSAVRQMYPRYYCDDIGAFTQDHAVDGDA